MKAWLPAVKAHYSRGTTTRATCFKVTRRDGVVLAATGHDETLRIDGIDYLSTSAYSPSDVVSRSDMSPDNLEIEGFLASPSITRADVKSGLWDLAKVEIFSINFRDLTEGKDYIREGTLGEVRAGTFRFTAELRGLLQALSRQIVQKTSRTCLNDFCDNGRTVGPDEPGCRLNLADFTVTGTVDASANPRTFTDAARAEAADTYTGGKVTFTSGANAGRSMEIKQHAGGGVFTLQQAMPDPIAPTDAYEMSEGCFKRRPEDCRDKRHNVINFYGSDFLPGQRIYKRGGVS